MQGINSGSWKWEKLWKCQRDYLVMGSGIKSNQAVFGIENSPYLTANQQAKLRHVICCSVLLEFIS